MTIYIVQTPKAQVVSHSLGQVLATIALGVEEATLALSEGPAEIPAAVSSFLAALFQVWGIGASPTAPAKPPAA